MGTSSDTHVRKSKKRIDNHKYQKKIAQVHQLIYNEGYVVQSMAVENILKAESYVPTSVSNFTKTHFIGY
jgi:hypothetical protein